MSRSSSTFELYIKNIKNTQISKLQLRSTRKDEASSMNISSSTHELQLSVKSSRAQLSKSINPMNKLISEKSTMSRNKGSIQ